MFKPIGIFLMLLIPTVLMVGGAFYINAGFGVLVSGVLTYIEVKGLMCDRENSQ